ncbi:hypothetical protein POTOM_058729 [Populus tomentosa]|uniref:Uncharacterized protein n=1 Tax=Populus tomentosa TaxID=118781 RepID=A0A8X7XRH6_POPTO|nr:hypothetical protein POTOM_058729 [Populus tomentosa]
MVDSDTSPQRSEFIRLEGLPDVTKQNNNQESLQEEPSTYVPTTTPEDAEPIEPAVRRSSRTIKPPQRFTLLLNYILLTDGGEPLTYEESLQDGNSSNIKHSISFVADKGLKKPLYSSARLNKGGVLYLETHLELCFSSPGEQEFVQTNMENFQLDRVSSFPRDLKSFCPMNFRLHREQNERTKTVKEV